MNEPFKEAVMIKGFQKCESGTTEYFIAFDPKRKSRLKEDINMEMVSFNITPYGERDNLFIRSLTRDGFTVVTEGRCTGFSYELDIKDVLPETEDILDGDMSAQFAGVNYSFKDEGMEEITAEERNVIGVVRNAYQEAMTAYQALLSSTNGVVNDFDKFPELKVRKESALEQYNKLLDSYPWAKRFTATTGQDKVSVEPKVKVDRRESVMPDEVKKRTIGK